MTMLPILLLLVVGCLTLVPLGYLLSASLRTGDSGWTLANYADVLHSSYMLQALAGTVAFCTVTAAAATLMSLPAAWWMARQRRGARFLRMMCQVNFAFSGVVYGMLIVTLLGNAGVLALLEQAVFGTSLTRGYVYSLGGLAVGYLGFQIPRAALIVAQSIEKLDPAALSAAKVLGASPAQVACLVVLPQLYRPMGTAFFAILMMSMASFGTALLIARSIEIFPVLIFREFTAFGDVNRAAAMGVLLAGATLALDMAARRLTAERKLHKDPA